MKKKHTRLVLSLVGKQKTQIKVLQTEQFGISSVHIEHISGIYGGALRKRMSNLEFSVKYPNHLR